MRSWVTVAATVFFFAANVASHRTQDSRGEPAPDPWAIEGLGPVPPRSAWIPWWTGEADLAFRTGEYAKAGWCLRVSRLADPDNGAYGELLWLLYKLQAGPYGSSKRPVSEDWKELLADLHTASCVGGEAAFVSRAR